MEIGGPKDKRKRDAFGSELSGSSKKAKGASKPTVANSNRQPTVLELLAAENLVSIANEREETSVALLELRQENVEDRQVGDQVQIELEQGQTKELKVEQSGEVSLRTSMESDKDLERTASEGFEGCTTRIIDQNSMDKQQDVLEKVQKTQNILHGLSEYTNINLNLLGMVFELEGKSYDLQLLESMKKQLAGFCQDYENLQRKLESLKEKIDQRVQQIEEQEAEHELEKRFLLLQIEESAIGNSAMNLAALKPFNAEENVIKLAEDQRRQKEELHNRITQLEKQLDQKQALGVEIEQLRGSFKEFKNMGDEEEALRKLEATPQELLKDSEGAQSFNQKEMDPARLPAAKENEREKKRKAQEASGAQSKRVAATSSTHDAPSITQRPTLRDREDISSPVGGALGVTPIVPASVASPEPPPSLFDDSAPPASLFDDDSAPIRGFPPGYFRGSFGQWHTEFCAQGAEPSITETVCALLQYDLKPGSVDDANALDQLSPAEIVVFLMISAYQLVPLTRALFFKYSNEIKARDPELFKILEDKLLVATPSGCRICGAQLSAI